MELLTFFVWNLLINFYSVHSSVERHDQEESEIIIEGDEEMRGKNINLRLRNGHGDSLLTSVSGNVHDFYGNVSSHSVIL